MAPRDIAVLEFDKSAVVRRSRSLPHWEMPGGIYFVTFRLDDSIPEEVSKAYFDEMRALEARLEGASPKDQRELAQEMLRLYCRRIDQCLDVGALL